MGEDTTWILARGHPYWGMMNLLAYCGSFRITAVPAELPVVGRLTVTVHIVRSMFRFFANPHGCAGASAQQLTLIWAWYFVVWCNPWILEAQQQVWPQSELENPVVANRLRINTTANVKENNFRITIISAIAKWSLPINHTKQV